MNFFVPMIFSIPHVSAMDRCRNDLWTGQRYREVAIALSPANPEIWWDLAGSNFEIGNFNCGFCGKSKRIIPHLFYCKKCERYMRSCTECSPDHEYYYHGHGNECTHATDDEGMDEFQGEGHTEEELFGPMID